MSGPRAPDPDSDPKTGSTSLQLSHINYTLLIKAVVEEEEEGMEVEEVDSDEWEEFDDDPIPVTDCLFCPHHSANLDNNIK